MQAAVQPRLSRLETHLEKLTAPLITKFESTGRLTNEIRVALASLPVHVKHASSGEIVVHEGDKPHTSILVLRGCVFRHKFVADGKRQILSFNIAGDMPDLQSIFLETMDHGLTSVGESELGHVPHEALRELVTKNPAAAQLLWRETLIDAAIFREWVSNTGRRRAVSRTAHLLCELVFRARAVGLAKDNVYAMQLTQSHFADALGLSMVHVNRSLQELRRAKLIELAQGKLGILNEAGLRKIGDFDPTYLHMPATG